MSYSSTVPTTGHSGSQDYVQMQQNYAQIQASFSVNHKPLASGGGTEGFHTVVQYPAVIADPGLASPECSLYIKTVSALSQLFFQNGALGSNVVQITGNIIAASGTSSDGGSYTVFQTPWGMRIFAGQAGSASGNRTVTMTGGPAFGSTIYGAAAVPTAAAGATTVAFTPGAGFNTFVISSGANVPVYWIVLTN